MFLASVPRGVGDLAVPLPLPLPSGHCLNRGRRCRRRDLTVTVLGPKAKLLTPLSSHTSAVRVWKEVVGLLSRRPLLLIMLLIMMLLLILLGISGMFSRRSTPTAFTTARVRRLIRGSRDPSALAVSDGSRARPIASDSTVSVIVREYGRTKGSRAGSLKGI